MADFDFTSKARMPRLVLRSRLVGLILRISLLSTMAMGVASCVASDRSLVSDAKPTMGRQFTAQIFRRFADGKAHELKAAVYRWEDDAYVNVGGAVDLRRFVSMPFEGQDEILQGSDAGGRIFTYWLRRKVAEGAYLIIPLDEGDVDPKVRAGLCADQKPYGFCFVDSKEHLLTLARATARSPVKDAALTVIVGDGLKPASDILDVRR